MIGLIDSSQDLLSTMSVAESSSGSGSPPVEEGYYLSSDDTQYFASPDDTQYYAFTT